MINIASLIRRGIDHHAREHDRQELTKVGTLRAGTTGMMDDKGRIIGQCAGYAWLRWRGYPTGPRTSFQKQLMFEAGRINEQCWLDNLLPVLPEGLTVKSETETPINWTTTQGHVVSGRPDHVLYQGSEPILGLELKNVSSVNSAYGKLVSQLPDVKHLLQAMHYMWQLGCPFQLWYTHRMVMDLPSWMQFRPFPQPSELGSESLQYSYYRFGEINPKTGKPIKHAVSEADYIMGKYNNVLTEVRKIEQFVQGFELDFTDDGALCFRKAVQEHETAGPWTKTVLTTDGIERFYNFVGSLELSTSKVPPEALNIDALGKDIAWRFRDYSDLKELDAGFWVGKPMSVWVNAITKKFGNK